MKKSNIQTNSNERKANGRNSSTLVYNLQHIFVTLRCTFLLCADERQKWKTAHSLRTLSSLYIGMLCCVFVHLSFHNFNILKPLMSFPSRSAGKARDHIIPSFRSWTYNQSVYYMHCVHLLILIWCIPFNQLYK